MEMSQIEILSIDHVLRKSKLYLASISIKKINLSINGSFGNHPRTEPPPKNGNLLCKNFLSTINPPIEVGKPNNL